MFPILFQITGMNRASTGGYFDKYLSNDLSAGVVYFLKQGSVSTSVFVPHIIQLTYTFNDSTQVVKNSAGRVLIKFYTKILRYLCALL
jgi:hypothetical protein